jgi:type IV fimbrial biogenesis protein FimT
MRNHGFTIIELMITVLIVAILAAVAVPGFRDFIGNTRVTGATNDLVTALNVARSEALQRGMPVAVCSSTNQSTCAGSNTWTTGWIAFTDNSGVAGVRDGAGVSADALVQSWPGLRGDMSATANANFVRYEVTGTITPPIGAASGAAAVTIDIKQTGCSGIKKGRTVVNVIGAVSSSKVACP